MTAATHRATAWFDTVWYQTVSLGAVTLVAGAALALAHLQTGPAIAAAEARDVAASLAQVLPAGFADNDLLHDTLELAGPDGKPRTIYRARQDGEIRAVIFQTRGRGYAGPIDLVMGVDRDGHVTGVRITRHAETPGLGDKIEAHRDPWVHDFAGRSLGNPAPARWTVRKDGGEFDQFAGATITPRAVVVAVREGLEYFEVNQSALFADTEPAKIELESGVSPGGHTPETGAPAGAGDGPRPTVRSTNAGDDEHSPADARSTRTTAPGETGVTTATPGDTEQ